LIFNKILDQALEIGFRDCECGHGVQVLQEEIKDGTWNSVIKNVR
jgi:hypothetical protein